MSDIDRLFLGILIGGTAAALLFALLFGFPGLSQPWATVIAGVGALIAAGIAYRAATAKVRSDLVMDERNRAERQRNLLVRLLYAARAAQRDIERFKIEISDTTSINSTRAAVEEVSLPRDISIIWENAGLLSIQISDAVGELIDKYSEIEDFSVQLNAVNYQDKDTPDICSKLNGLYYIVSSRTNDIITKINADLNDRDPSRGEHQARRALFD